MCSMASICCRVWEVSSGPTRGVSGMSIVAAGFLVSFGLPSQTLIVGALHGGLPFKWCVGRCGTISTYRVSGDERPLRRPRITKRAPVLVDAHYYLGLIEACASRCGVRLGY
ncbi:hypothetical protein NDU88_005242, partial [Pleurodeles waltl]